MGAGAEGGASSWSVECAFALTGALGMIAGRSLALEASSIQDGDTRSYCLATARSTGQDLRSIPTALILPPIPDPTSWPSLARDVKTAHRRPMKRPKSLRCSADHSHA